MVLPAPMTLTASPLACVPSAWILAPADTVSMPLEPNSTVLLPAVHRPAPEVAVLLTTAPAPRKMVALSPRLMVLALPTASWALGWGDRRAGRGGRPWPIGVVAGFGALVLQVVLVPEVTQAA